MITTSERNGLGTDTFATCFDVRDGLGEAIRWGKKKQRSRSYVMPEFQSHVLRNEDKHSVAPVFFFLHNDR